MKKKMGILLMAMVLAFGSVMGVHADAIVDDWYPTDEPAYDCRLII